MKEVAAYLIPSEAKHLLETGIATVYAEDLRPKSGIQCMPLYRERTMPPMIEKLHEALSAFCGPEDKLVLPEGQEADDLTQAWLELDQWLQDPKPQTMLRTIGRAAFEESVVTRYADHAAPEFLLLRNPNGEYRNTGVHGEWIGWQTAWAYRAEPVAPLGNMIIEKLVKHLVPLTEQSAQELNNELNMLLTTIEDREVDL